MLSRRSAVAALTCASALAWLAWPTVARGDRDRVATARNVPNFASRPPWLGIVFERVSGGGVRASAIVTDSPAERAGVREGDSVVAIQGQPVSDPEGAVALVRRSQPGQSIALVVVRGAQRVQLSATLAHQPALEDLRAQTPPPMRPSWVTGPSVVDPAQLRGRVVIMDFFASWCGPCRATMPWLDGLQQRLGPRGLTVVGVTDESAPVARRLSSSLGIRYAIATDRTASIRWAVSSLPTLVVIDRRGVVREVYAGMDPARTAALEGLVRRLLNEP
ncbi:MAG: redoxin family protein [Myxococcales bacterium]|nr:redoxin family protein [Myxococcales bacterium]